MPIFLATSAADGSIIIPLIVLAVWAVGAILSKASKKPGQKKRSWEEILKDLAGQGSTSTPPTVPPQPARPEPPPVETPRPVPAMRQQTPSRQMPRPLTSQGPQMPGPIARAKPPMRAQMIKKRPRPAPPRIVVPPQPDRPALSQPLTSAAPEPRVIAISQAHPQGTPESSLAASRQATSSAKAKALHKWLTPATMRGQFILTEVLRSPLSIREET